MGYGSDYHCIEGEYFNMSIGRVAPREDWLLCNRLLRNNCQHRLRIDYLFPLGILLEDLVRENFASAPLARRRIYQFAIISRLPHFDFISIITVTHASVER